MKEEAADNTWLLLNGLFAFVFNQTRVRLIKDNFWAHRLHLNFSVTCFVVKKGVKNCLKTSNEQACLSESAAFVLGLCLGV